MDFDLIKAPGPTITALTAPFWDAAEQGRLIIQHCEDCGSAVFYPRPLCPHCWSARLIWKDAQGTGKLKSWSTVHRSAHPAWQPVAPYTVGVVALAEGPTMLSLILKPGAKDHALDAPVKLRPTRVAGRTLPAFELI